MRTSRVLALAGFLILGACTSIDNAGAASKCTCGTIATAVTGCHHPLCAAGKANPENVNCHCGPIATSAPAHGGN